jgi:hypothetical protein
LLEKFRAETFGEKPPELLVAEQATSKGGHADSPT